LAIDHQDASREDVPQPIQIWQSAWCQLRNCQQVGRRAVFTPFLEKGENNRTLSGARRKAKGIHIYQEAVKYTFTAFLPLPENASCLCLG